MQLCMREASFLAEGSEPVGPLSFELAGGERRELAFSTDREAWIAAMLAAAIVKPTAGNVLIESFDSRIQPAACKRVVGYVPHDPIALTRSRFRDFIWYRAELWGIDPQGANARADALVERLAGMHEAFAYPLAAALVTSPQILVIDRLQPQYASTIFAVAGECAVLSTHVRV